MTEFHSYCEHGFANVDEASRSPRRRQFAWARHGARIVACATVASFLMKRCRRVKEDLVSDESASRVPDSCSHGSTWTGDATHFRHGIFSPRNEVQN